MAQVDVGHPWMWDIRGPHFEKCNRKVLRPRLASPAQTVMVLIWTVSYKAHVLKAGSPVQQRSEVGM